MFSPRRILVPTDFSEDSDEALKQALELADQYHAKVYLLHVTEPVTQCAGDFCLDETAVRAAGDSEKTHAREMMQKELSKFSQWRDIEVISDIREGDPAVEILREQDERGVDLIVMPSHKKTGFMKRLMGQISEQIMEEAKTPVLLVRH